jgi:predicted chitinase
MTLDELFPDDINITRELEEGPLKDLLGSRAGQIAKAGAVAAGVLGSTYLANRPEVNPPRSTDTPAITQPYVQPAAVQPENPVAAAGQIDKATAAAPVSPKPTHISSNIKEEVLLRRMAEMNGIHGTELAAFLAQCNHESMDFDQMGEMGSSRYFQHMYDKKHNPDKAQELGNVKAGDGERYHGRGFIQITGRENYRKAGEALKLPLEKHPEMAENPVVAAKIAVWYWKNRVAPNVSDFSDTKSVTKHINPGLKDLDKRDKTFIDYQRMI